MKKFLSLLICFSLASMPAFAITDEFVEQTLDKNLKIKPPKEIIITDTFAEKSLSKNLNNVERRKVVVNDKSAMTPVSVRIKRPYSSQDNLQEGDTIEFMLTKPVTINGKTYPAGEIVNARLETVSMNEVMGVPSDVIVGNFNLDGIPLGGEINKTGANRSFWVYPSIYIFSIFFGAGLLFIPIRGGHAKIRTNETFTLYAE